MLTPESFIILPWDHLEHHTMLPFSVISHLVIWDVARAGAQLSLCQIEFKPIHACKAEGRNLLFLRFSWTWVSFHFHIKTFLFNKAGHCLKVDNLTRDFTVPLERLGSFFQYVPLGRTGKWTIGVIGQFSPTWHSPEVLAYSFNQTWQACLWCLGLMGVVAKKFLKAPFW